MGDTTINRIDRRAYDDTAHDVVFVHGLGGDKETTWQASDSDHSFWPSWIAEDDTAAAVWSIGYDAAGSNWIGHAMPLVDRASNLLALLDAEHFGQRPIIFICHSLGGIVVKQMLRSANDLGNAGWQSIANQTEGLIFLATPHGGARLANYLSGLGRILALRPSASADDLNANHEGLRDLNSWFRNHVSAREISVRVFFEKQDTKGVRIVDETSADPGLTGSPPIAIDADHFSICKPANRQSLVYKSSLRFITDLFSEDNIDEEPSIKLNKPTVKGRPVRFFIAYRRSAMPDGELARELSKRLKEMGHDVFIDTDMPIGRNWVSAIEQALTQCDFVIPLLSDESMHSEMMLGEIRTAHRHRIQHGTPGFLPVRVNFDGLLDYEISSYLYRIQHVAWRGRSDTSLIVDSLVEAATTPYSETRSTDDSSQISSTESPQSSTRDQTLGVSPQLNKFKVRGQIDRPLRPRPKIDLDSLIRPTGAMKPGDPAYVRRNCDNAVDRLAECNGTTLIIKAPRQMGKSSLLQRYAAGARARDKHVVTLDLQLDETVLSDLPTLLRHITKQIHRRLKLPQPDTKHISGTVDLTEHFEDEILPSLRGQLVFAIDEADLLLQRPFGRVFFGMIRAWHNFRAEEDLPWQQVDIALIVATEPYLFIPDATQSPFNVGENVTVHPFDADECSRVNELHGDPLNNSQLHDLVELTGGQPYLLRETFYQLSIAGAPNYQALESNAAGDDGPFGHHLKHLMIKLRDGELLDAMQQVIQHGTVPDNDQMIYERLKGGGLVRREDDRIVPANRLYARFFRDKL